MSTINSNRSRLLQGPKVNIRHAPATDPTRLQNFSYSEPVRMLRHFSRRLQRNINELSHTVNIVHGLTEVHEVVLKWMFTSCRLGYPAGINPQIYTFYRFAHVYDAAAHLEVPPTNAATSYLCASVEVKDTARTQRDPEGIRRFPPGSYRSPARSPQRCNRRC